MAIIMYHYYPVHKMTQIDILSGFSGLGLGLEGCRTRLQRCTLVRLAIAWNIITALTLPNSPGIAEPGTKHKLQLLLPIHTDLCKVNMTSAAFAAMHWLK